MDVGKKIEVISMFMAYNFSEKILPNKMKIFIYKSSVSNCCMMMFPSLYLASLTLIKTDLEGMQVFILISNNEIQFFKLTIKLTQKKTDETSNKSLVLQLTYSNSRN